VEPVRSTRNSRVSDATRLQRARRRAETGRTLVEGPHLLMEAVAAGAVLETVFVSVDDETSTTQVAALGVDIVLVTPAVMAKVAGTQHPRGPVAVIVIPPDRPAVGGSLVVSWGVRDPGNVGTLIRSAAAFGLGYLSGPGSADPWSPKVLRAGAGAHFRTTVERPVSISVGSLQGRGFTVVATVVQGGAPPERLAGMERCALLIGDETAGLPANVVESADLRISIPMPGRTESLNAGVAGSLLAYELAKTAKDLPHPD
jgi:TrmH family RNA methyltransferase